MGISPLLLAFVILFPLVQVPAVLYLSRYLEMDADVAETPPTERYWDNDVDAEANESRQSSRASSSASPGKTCPACGATNDPAYRFCESCVARLTG